MMRSYCLATFCPFRWKAEGVKEFSSFAFLSIGYHQQMEVLGEKLDLEPRQYFSRDVWCVGWDLVAGQGPDDHKEIQMKLWEVEQFGIRWQWSKDLIPGMPSESGDGVFMNTFDNLDEALAAVLKPIEPSTEHWKPHRRHYGNDIDGNVRQSQKQSPGLRRGF
jgi:hypothetical protein